MGFIDVELYEFVPIRLYFALFKHLHKMMLTHSPVVYVWRTGRHTSAHPISQLRTGVPSHQYMIPLHTLAASE